MSESGWYTPPSANNDSTAADQFLTGGGVPSAFGKEDPIGATVAGYIVEAPVVKQQTDIETGKPMTWDNGDPRMQLVVTIQQEGVPVTDEDDGRRRIYVKGSKTPGTHSMHDAVASAVREVGARGLEEGGFLVVQLFGTEPSKTRGFNDRKLWRAQYRPPAPGAVSGGFLGTATPAPQVPPMPQYAPPAPAVVVSPPPAPAYAPPAGPPDWATPPQGAAQAAPAAQGWANTPAPPASPPQPPVAPTPTVPASQALTPEQELAAYQAWKASQQAPQA